MLSRIRSAWGELGGFNTVLHGINRVAGAAGLPLRIFRYYFVAQPVAPEPLLPARRGAQIEVRRLEPGDAALLSLPLTPEVLRYRFAQGAVCHAAFAGDRIVGCLWFCFGRYDEDEVRCRYLLRPEAATSWDFDVYVAPEARGGLAFVRLWDVANAYLRERGVGWSLSRISAFNPGSLAAHGRLGARRVASALFLRCGPGQLMLAGRPPYVHIGCGKGRTPQLEVHAPSAPGHHGS